MIVINDDSSDDDEFKPLPSLLERVRSPVKVRLARGGGRRRRDDGMRAFSRA
jgi:hypothetical protein